MERERWEEPAEDRVEFGVQGLLFVLEVVEGVHEHFPFVAHGLDGMEWMEWNRQVSGWVFMLRIGMR